MFDNDELARELYEIFYGFKPKWTGINFYEEWVTFARNLVERGYINPTPDAGRKEDNEQP